MEASEWVAKWVPADVEVPACAEEFGAFMAEVNMDNYPDDPPHEEVFAAGWAAARRRWELE